MTGVYKIATPNNFYIGSASNIKSRKNRHLFDLRKGVHHNLHLQRAFNKYGEEKLVFTIILICNKDNLLFYEQKALDVLKPTYNICVSAKSPMTGRKHSFEAISKMKLTRSTVEYRNNHSLKMKGRGHPSTQETNAKIRAAQARKIQCLETGVIFSSVFEAVRWLNTFEKALCKNAGSNINMVIRGEGATAYGYHWILIESE